MKFLAIVVTIIILIGCQKKEELTADAIVDKAIMEACMANCSHAEIDFIFRKIQYKSIRNDGSFQFERTFIDSIGSVRDVLTNTGFERFRNDSLVTLPDSIASTYANSVNSVHYFVQIPFGLKDPAVQKQLLGDAVINNEPYFEIGVTFQKQGGGTDFEDKFVYWIHKEDYTVDYFAYSYKTDGGGIRFREAYNVRTVEGIRFADYNNYKTTDFTVRLTELDQLFQAGKLQLVSTIETENIRVSLLDGN